MAQPSNHIQSFDESSFSQILTLGGEMGQRILNFDWAATPLGSIETWPHSLRTIVCIMLTSRQPIWIGWGPELIKLYNDPYRAIVGGKHPDALGQPASVVWRDIWHDIAPMLKVVMEKNEGTYVESQLLIMERYGYPEETYYTFSYNPVLAEYGGVGGMICTNTDDTQRVINERQLGLLRTLAANTADAKTVEEVCALSANSLERNPHDLPFALLYLVDADKKAVRLAGTTHIDQNHPAVLQTVELDVPSLWPFREAIETNKSLVVTTLGKNFGNLPMGVWKRPPHQALVIPISQPNDSGKSAVLIVGLNPFRQLDEGYEGFLNLVAGQIGSSLANAQAYEEERKRAQALDEINRAKTLFFSNVSHEFRTPLTLLLGPIEDALNDPITLDINKERMDIAHRNALRLLKLVNALLDFSRIEAGRIQATYQATDLAAYTADLASGFRSAIEKAGMKLVIDTPPLTHPVYVDHEMWEKIVLNLLSNAFKYTLEGTITVAIKQHEDVVELTVSDTGVGIPEAELPRMFERFHQVKGTEGRSQEGTGIGLSLVQELVKLHGGTISVTSTVGQGSTFSVVIPLGTAHLPQENISGKQTLASTRVRARTYIEEAIRWLPEHQPVSEIIPDVPVDADLETQSMKSALNGGQKARIVLADDNNDMREYLQRLLSHKYTVEAVTDGMAALQAIENQPPDLVLTDVMMPRLDGFGVLQALRENPTTRTIPVIMLSARAGEEARIEGVEAGADDYLVKPFSARELLARVAAHLDMAQLRKQAQAAVETERQRLYDIFMQAPAIVAVLTGPNFVFELANPWYMRLVGEGREIIGKPVEEALPEIKRQGFLELLENVYRTGKPFVGSENVTELDRHGDGKLEEVYVNFVYQPYRDAEGQIQGILVYAVDITEQVKARQQVEAQNRVLEMITSGAPLSQALEFLLRSLEQHSGHKLMGSILLMDNDGEHLRLGAAPSLPQPYNEAVDGIAIGPEAGSCGTAAYRKQPVIVSDIATDPLWKDFRDLALEHNLRACWSTPICSGESLLGTFALYYPHIYTPTDEDRKLVAFATRTAMLAIERDRMEAQRTQLLQQEQQARRAAEKADQMKLQFLGMISHELRTPLTSIKGFTTTLLADDVVFPYEQQQAFLRIVDKETDKLTSLVEQLLDLSRLQAGALRIEIKPQPFADILSTAAVQIQTLTHQHQLHVEIPDDLPLVLADRERIAQVLVNLVGNAVKFSPPNSTITIRAEHVNGKVQVEVRDYGIGIPLADRETVFEAFRQVERKNPNQRLGVGLGLAICRAIVQAHHENIWIEGNEPTGTRIAFTLAAAE